MNKKTLILILVVVVLFLVGGFIYFSSSVDSENNGGRGGVLSIFGTSPFGGAEINTATSSAGGGLFGTFGETGGFSRLQLRRLVAIPVAGAGFAKDKDENNVVRYIDRATGHIYEIGAQSVTPRKISNVTIPRIQEALWSRDGRNVIFQYLSGERSVSTFVGKINEEDEDTPLDGFFLPDDTTRAIFSPDGTQIFYLRNRSGIIRGYTAGTANGEAVREIFDSPITGWDIAWTTPSAISLISSYYAEAPGVHMQIHPRSGAREYLPGENDGLSAISNNTGKFTLLNRSTARSMRAALYDSEANTTNDLPFGTLAEKCVWGRADTSLLICAFPQFGVDAKSITRSRLGEIFFSDMLWEVDIKERTNALLADPKEAISESLDITNPVISPDDKHIIFINKNDLTLWIFSFLDEKAEEPTEEKSTETGGGDTSSQ